jgi:carbamoylphosphate synthase small subunit
MKSEDKQTCFLLLEDGTVLPGESFGARNHIDGEVVFQTGWSVIPSL